MIEKGVIGKTHAVSNNSFFGKHSCGYYDVRKFKKGKKEHLGDIKYLKTNYAHIGVSITRNHIYIEDKYLDILEKVK